MVNWKELGEIPDSEDENGFDSQELAPVAVPVLTTVTISKTNDNAHKETLPPAKDKETQQDIWDVPDSSQAYEQPTVTNQAPRQPTPASPPAEAVWLNTSPLSSPMSSPLSPARSDIELPPVDVFSIPSRGTTELESQPPNESQHQLVGEDEISESYVKLSSPTREFASQEESTRKVLANAVARPIPIQSQELGHDDERQVARQAAVRYERSLRPRKPIQEHPYLLENAQYSTLLRQNGVRPLKMALEAERRRRQQASQEQEQDEDFEDDSQGSRLPDISEESQLYGLEDFMDGMDSLAVPSPSPPKTSPMIDRAGPSSQASSAGETDTTSLPGEDLPALEDLMKQNIRSAPNRVTKRRSSPPRSTARKRKRYDVVDSDPLEPAATLRLGAHHLDSPAAARNSRRSPERDVAMIEDVEPPRMQSPSPAPVQRPPRHLTTSVPPRPLVIESESENELAQDPPSGPDDGGSASESEPESDRELVNTVGRRIRGVLPASWLRLDQQAFRLKNPKDPHQRHKDRSPEREPRRGVAQRRQATQRADAVPFPFFEDSDDDTPAPRERTTDEVFHNQTRLVLEKDLTPSASMAIPNISEELWSDDGASVIEDNAIDHMLPGRKRQSKLSESFGSTPKRRKNTTKRQNVPSFKPPGQMSITNMFDGSQATTSSAKELVKKKYRQPKSGHRSKSKSTKRQSKHSRRPAAPPRLSILDVIEPNAPRFLKIAARAAKDRRDQGRSSPAKKQIRLGTREDHLDAVSVLHNWRAGSIPQRSSVSAARKQKKAKLRPPKEPLGEASPNLPPTQRRQPPPSSATPRRLVRQVTHGGTVSYQSDKPTQPTSARQQPRPNKQLSRTGSGTARPAQLEMDETNQGRSFMFKAKKRRLDHLYRKQRSDFSNASSLAFNDSTTDAGHPASPPPEENPVPLRIVKPLETEKPKSRYRKKTRPQQVDIEAPQFSRANDPIPMEVTPVPEPVQVEVEGERFRGLGPYGTRYTYHFETFPLNSRVYFHESTLIGSGILESIFNPIFCQRFFGQRFRSAYNLGEQTLRWGPWDAQVSSELGVVMDFVADQLECGPANDSSEDCPPALSATAFVMKFMMDSLSLTEPTNAKSFVGRMLEVLRGIDGRVKTLLNQSDIRIRPQCGLIASIYDHLLVVAFLVLSLCRNDDSLMGDQFQIEDLLKDMAKTAVSSLLNAGLDQVSTVYTQFHDSRFRERGLRGDVPTLHSWVFVRKILEHTRIPRSSFWDIVYAVMATPEAMNSLDAQQHEQLWKNMFILLPLTEFNDKGIIAAGSRHDATVDGWSLPQKLMKKVFQLYQENPRQSPSFNNYCRALVGRCHYLVQQWGWRKCVAVIGVIFDFFGSQNLAHLRNEEVFKSPKFLEELGGSPSLAVEKGDRCFHIFLKLIALSIQKLKEVDSLKDIRNLVARTMPNHNRQLLKEQTIHERELAALRNHHDLLCTLFWASPPDLRPGTHLIERLVVPASSHKEACLINLRSWSQLARFVIASGEATTSFKPFAQWRNGFFQSLMQQFDSVASDMHQQFLALTKDGSNTVSSEMVDAMVKVNRAAVMDVIHFSITASLDVMRRATDLEAATFALNTLQLQQVFKHFTACPPDLDWSILQAALATLEIFLSHVDEFKENEESQQSESQILNSAQADDAILVLDHDLSANFFSMARAIISARSERNLSTTAAVDKFRCTEMVVTLSARLGVRFMNGGLMRLVDMFKFGKYGLFEDMPVKINLDQRKYLALFITTLLKQGYDDFNDAGFTLSEVWVLSIVKPRNYLAYENQFAQELQRHGKDIVPEAAAGLAINPDYSTNRDMFEFAASWMRKSMRDAGPALRKMMLSEYSKTLKAVMQQIKGDLRAVSQDATEHPSYVTFIRDIVALIRAHGPDICTVDDFFYQINKEYSPSVQDPQLQVAGMLSYGLRLSEGDTRVIHQLFFFLFNNFKMSMINNKLGDELKMLHRGMKNPGILAFILGKMLPAVIQASFIESSAFPLLEVYVEAMRVLLTRSVIPHELTEQDLQSVVVTVAAFVNGLEKLSQDMGTMTLQQVDVLINVLSLINTLWPSFRVLSICEPTSVAWDEVCDALKCARGSIKRAEELTRDLLVLEDYSLTGGILVAGVQRPGTDTVQADTYIKSFTDNIVNDVRRNWVFTENKISIQAPGKGRNTQSTQSGQGVDRPVWNVKELVEDLHEHTKEWSAWYRRVFEASPLSTEYCVSVLF